VLRVRSMCVDNRRVAAILTLDLLQGGVGARALGQQVLHRLRRLSRQSEPPPTLGQQVLQRPREVGDVIKARGVYVLHTSASQGGEGTTRNLAADG